MLADLLYQGTPNSNPNVVKGNINMGNYMGGDVLFLKLDWIKSANEGSHVKVVMGF